MGEDIARQYDASSEHYDLRYKQIQFDKYGMALSFLGGVEGDILDVGCGTGLLGEFLGRVIDGIDISRGMLERSKGRVRYVHGDARDLPYDDGTYDIVFSFTMLQNIKDYDQAIREIRRVMRRGGRCVLTYLNKEQYSGIGRSIDETFHVDHSFTHGEDVFYICSLSDCADISQKRAIE
ncbi:MAG TPA: class I SAM-dependent methyltransferase [Candidatus Methanofastidiosa archaeon]|nr:class I SAM-dependent methyltransferase [Candidatus Methanofastidiosa archaeon]